MSGRGRIGGIEVVAPLSPEEERRLYPVITRGREAAARLNSGRVKDHAERRRWARQRHDGQVAESLLLRATLGLVRARVVERGYRFGDEELEAAGLEGLVNALSRFDPDKGARFSTYANYWIAKLVNQAIQQQAGLRDTEMRAVLAYQKLERSVAPRIPSLAEVAAALGVSAGRAEEVVQMSRDLQSRRYESAPFEDAPERRPPPEAAPTWVIDELKRLCGADFDAFWQYTFHSSSMSELAAERSISRQAMSKRLERCRRAVRESPSAERLQAWLDSQ